MKKLLITSLTVGTVLCYFFFRIASGNENEDLQEPENSARIKRGVKSICYEALGCFQDEPPFDSWDMVPESPENIKTKFLVYTRNGPEEVYDWDNYTTIADENESQFNASNPTKFIIHGFKGSCSRSWTIEMRQALLDVADCNVVCVDWRNGAGLPNYFRAAVNARLVGKQVSMFIEFLNNNMSSSNENFHLIGFSLGAHVSGIAGSHLQNLSRITGLDPAGPMFEKYDIKFRLDPTDAKFVDVIHTNANLFHKGGLGSWRKMGHLDFYPNGGKSQNGCSNLFTGLIRDVTSGRGSYAKGMCSHRRAFQYFTESITSDCQFYAFRCESFDKYLTGECFHDNENGAGFSMGYYADSSWNSGQEHHAKKNNTLFLLTEENPPFCGNQYKIKIESTPSLNPITTHGKIKAVFMGEDENDGVVGFFNRTFSITTTKKDKILSGSVLQRVVVSRHELTTPLNLALKYKAYKSWLYSGADNWSVDKVVVTSASGVSFSYCSSQLTLPSGVPVMIELTPGICDTQKTESQKTNETLSTTTSEPS